MRRIRREGARISGHWPRLGLACALVAALLVSATVALGASADTAWTLAGTGVAADSGDGGQAREAAINLPRSVSATADGGYAWAEPWSHRVRIVGPDGIVTTLAGTGTEGFGGDGGAAIAAKVNFVHTAAPTADGGYLLADTRNNRIRKVSSSGLISTVAGTGTAGYSGDGGSATAAQINNPRGVVALSDGGFLIPDSNNHRVRKVSAAGVITTVAGTGAQGFSGDGGPAVAAQLSVPFDVAPTADGGFLIVDVGNQRIRKVSAAGVISTVAGNGVAGFGGDGGPASAASLKDPHDVVATADGGFLIADSSNERVRRVGPDGVISTLIGDGVRGYTGDAGPAAAARVSVPKGVAVTGAGDVVIAEEGNNRIRFVGTVVAPTSTTLPAISGSPLQGQQLTATAGGWSGTGPLVSYQWQRCSSACASIAGAVTKTYTVAAADAGARLRVAVTASNPAGAATAASAETAAVAGGSAPPSSTSPPLVSGTAQEGQTLSATPGSWSGTEPIAHAYRWQRCSPACADVAAGTGNTYPVAAADVGSTLRVTVTATNSAGSAEASSAHTSPVVAAPSPGGGTSGTVPPATTPAAPAPPAVAAAAPAPPAAAAATAPAASAAPARRAASWLVRTGKTFQRAGEYTVGARTSRLLDAFGAYGAPSQCRVVKPRRVVATWAGRGIRIDGRTYGALAAGKAGCSSGLASVLEIRLTERRWTTVLGLHVGDATTKLRRLYPKARFVAKSNARLRDQYHLVLRRRPCTGDCTAAEKRYGVHTPRLTAEVARSRVIALRLHVLAETG